MSVPSDAMVEEYVANAEEVAALGELVAGVELTTSAGAYGRTTWRSVDPPPKAGPTGPTDLAAAVAAALIDGPGFIIVRGLPPTDLDGSVQQLLGLAGTLGRVHPQTAAGDLVGTVETSGYRGEMLPHTDAADAIALLCLRPASDGGQSVLVDFERCYRSLTQASQAALREPIAFGLGLGDETTAADRSFYLLPVVTERGGRFFGRYVEGPIRAGERAFGAPGRSDSVRTALSALHGALLDPANQVEVTLQPGEVLICSNHRILHGRRAYEDPSRQTLRMLVRLAALDGHRPSHLDPEGARRPAHYL